MTKKNYWLHLTYHKGAVPGMQPKYSMSCSTPTKEGGVMEQVHFPEWEDLHALLSSVHCGEDELSNAKKSLDEHASYTLHEVWLEDDQLQRLGFDPEKCQ